MDLTRSSSDRLWHEEHTAVSEGDDHSFNGVMFNVACRAELLVETLYLRSVSVRGELGDISVYAKRGTFNDCYEDPRAWMRIYRAQHDPSCHRLVKLQFETPVSIPAHGSAALYIHSTKPWDRTGMGAIVYKNLRSRFTIERPIMAVSPAMAHTACEPFRGRGFWGTAWRPRREFVGAIEYAVRWKLWTPENHRCFGSSFRAAVRTMLFVHRYSKTALARLSQDMVFYILNFLGHDAFYSAMASSDVQPQARHRRKLATDQFGSTVVLESDDEVNRMESWSGSEERDFEEVEDDEPGEDAEEEARL